MIKKPLISIVAALGLAGMALSPAPGQVDTVDPDAALDDSAYQSGGTTTDNSATFNDGPDFDPDVTAEDDTTVYSDPNYIPDTPGYEDGAAPDGNAGDSATPAEPTVPGEEERRTTYQQDDLIAAADGLFGDGAQGLARMIQDILSEQGEPNGYIVGREAGGAFIFGLRYGSGTLFHAVEGEQPVYWTGPSIGFDAGANGASTFVLVYNLYDTEELFRRFPAVSGNAYLVGGLTASYLRSGDKVLIPIRLGAGLRLGANIGYMNFSRNRRWLPF
ncbi:DUF1134 domain-containing protein [Parasphingopyxis lamellibrachiae]|uniref:DUF1134 domain-containing protein n=1 Tax=Parasphingopyxis lamellibrachiae TaxID=680125 RepID=A0A3D9FG94_9SPHN|nr:DUF1134 domain-containing protein [Parasphingopyxis lamellibrachiae]RED16793.1 hypothetical protein DFR46_1824 [Parasphingopyxis lamellibrachiae]